MNPHEELAAKGNEIIDVVSKIGELIPEDSPELQNIKGLHLEFTKNDLYLRDSPIKPVGDILILAGDITYWEEEYFNHWFFDYVSDNFKAVYFIPGNHEFYSGKDVKSLDNPVFESLRDNVFLVNNKVVNIEGIDFFFTSFWSCIPENKSLIIEQSINEPGLKSIFIAKLIVDKNSPFRSRLIH